jgi:hypothetical protein
MAVGIVANVNLLRRHADEHRRQFTFAEYRRRAWD